MIEHGIVNKLLKPYMLFSRAGGPEEGAILVIAHSVREARKIGFGHSWLGGPDDYMDCAARLLRDSPWLLDEANPVKYANNEAHVIDCPKSCKECERWGERIGSDGICQSCRDEREYGLEVA